MKLTEASVNDSHHDVQRLLRDCECAAAVSSVASTAPVQEASVNRLFLVVDNAGGPSAASRARPLDPNSSEITRIILSLGKSLNW